MCSTQQTAGIAGGMQLFGLLSSASSAQMAAESQKEQLRVQAAMANVNSNLGEQQAQQAIDAGQLEESKSRVATANLKGSQRAAMAANGVALDEGSALSAQTSTDIMGEIDANTIRTNALMQAWGYRTQSSNARAQAMTTAAAGNAINPGSAWTSTLLGGAGTVAASWAKLKQ